MAIKTQKNKQVNIEGLKTLTLIQIKDLTAQYKNNTQFFESQIEQKEEFLKSLDEQELEDIINGRL